MGYPREGSILLFPFLSPPAFCLSASSFFPSVRVELPSVSRECHPDSQSVSSLVPIWIAHCAGGWYSVIKTAPPRYLTLVFPEQIHALPPVERRGKARCDPYALFQTHGGFHFSVHLSLFFPRKQGELSSSCTQCVFARLPTVLFSPSTILPSP